MNESPLPNNNRLPRLNSAPGSDGVCYKLLKLAKPAISEILDALFQQSIDMACIPSDWRQGRVLPILKFDDPLNPSNYRPFSLTSTCCEILQHIISYTVMKFLTEHIFFLQSTCIFAWSIMRDATLWIDHWPPLHSLHDVDAILADFAKVFDKISHLHLLHKLRYFSINKKRIKWINNFWTSRYKSAFVNNQSPLLIKFKPGAPRTHPVFLFIIMISPRVCVV